MTLKAEIEKFHEVFGLPAPACLQPLTLERTLRFKEILQDELSEVEDIIAVLRGAPDDEQMLDAQVMLADWLGDIIVYCASEARRHGIPLENVLEIIFLSNLSKLGDDGKAIIANGKVQKGPNYWRPEGRIRDLLRERSYMKMVLGV